MSKKDFYLLKKCIFLPTDSFLALSKKGWAVCTHYLARLTHVTTRLHRCSNTRSMAVRCRTRCRASSRSNANAVRTSFLRRRFQFSRRTNCHSLRVSSRINRSDGFLRATICGRAALLQKRFLINGLVSFLQTITGHALHLLGRSVSRDTAALRAKAIVIRSGSAHIAAKAIVIRLVKLRFDCLRHNCPASYQGLGIQVRT